MLEVPICVFQEAKNHFEQVKDFRLPARKQTAATIYNGSNLRKWSNYPIFFARILIPLLEFLAHLPMLLSVVKLYRPRTLQKSDLEVKYFSHIKDQRMTQNILVWSM